MVEVEERVAGGALERQGAGAGLEETRRGGGHAGERGTHHQGLAFGDVDHARGGDRAVRDDALSVEGLRDAEHAGIRREREAGETGTDGDGALLDGVAEVGVGRDADDAAVDIEAVEAIAAAEDERAVTGLGEGEAGEIAGRGLGHGATGAHDDGRAGGLEDGEVVGDREVLVQHAERAAVEHDVRGRRQGGGAAEVEQTGVDLGEAGVGVRALQVDETRAGLDEVIETTASAVLDDAGEDHAGIRVVLREGTRRAGSGAVSGVGQADAAAQREVGVAAAIRVEDRVAEHDDVVGEAQGLRDASEPEVQIRAQSTAVEDEPTGAEGVDVRDFEDGALVEGEVTREGVGGVEEDEAAAVGRGDRLSLDGVAEDADLDRVGADEDAPVDGEHAVAAEAVGGIRADAERGRGVSGGLEGLTGIHAAAQEEPAVGGSGREVERGAETDDVDAEETFGHRSGAGPGDDRRLADVLQAEQAEGGAIGAQGDAAADRVRGSETQLGAGVDGDRAGTEGPVGTHAGEADERNQRAFVDGDRLGVGRAERPELHQILSPLLERTRAGDRSEDVGGGIGLLVAAEGGRALQVQRVEVKVVVAGRTDDDGRAEIVVLVSVDRQPDVGGQITPDVGVAVHDHLGLIVHLGVRMKLGAVEDQTVAESVGIGGATAQGILMVGTDPVVTAEDDVAGQSASVIGPDTQVAGAGLGEAASDDLTVEVQHAAALAQEDEFAAVRDDDIGRQGRFAAGMDEAAGSQGQREGGDEGNTRTIPDSRVTDPEVGAVDHFGDDRIGHDARTADRLADPEVGRGGIRDDVGTASEITGDRSGDDGGETGIETKRVDRGIVGERRGAALVEGGRAVRQAGRDGRRTARGEADLAASGRGDQERLQAERRALVAQESEVRAIDDPGRHHAARRHAGTVRRRTRIGEGGRDAESIEAGGGVERAGGRGVDPKHATLGSAQDVRDLQDRGARVVAVDIEGAVAEADGDCADLFEGIEVIGTGQTEATPIQGQADGVTPAALIAGPSEETGSGAGIVVIENDESGLAEADDVGRGGGPGVEGRALETTEGEIGALAHFDDTGTERRGAGGGAAGFDDERGAAIDDRAAGIVVGVLDDDRADGVTRDRLIAREERDRCADFDGTGGAGEDVVRAREPKRIAAAEAVAIIRARGERAEELAARVELTDTCEGAEILATVADRAHIERAGEVRERDLHGAAERRSHRSGRERAAGRGEVAVEGEDTEVVRRAEDGDARGATDAGSSGETEGGVRIDDDRTGAEGIARGRGDLEDAREDISTPGVGVRAGGDAEGAPTLLIQGEEIGRRGILDDARQIDDGATVTRGDDVEDGGIAASDRAGEAEVLRVRRGLRAEPGITEGQVAELEIDIGEAGVEDAIVIGGDRGAGTVDDDGDAAGGGAAGADDHGQAGSNARHVQIQQTTLQSEGRSVVAEARGRVQVDLTRAEREARLGIDVGERIGVRRVIQIEGGGTALDDADGTRAVLEAAVEGLTVGADHDQGACGGGGVGDESGGAGEGADLDEAAVEVDGTRVVEDEVDGSRLGGVTDELDRTGLHGEAADEGAEVAGEADRTGTELGQAAGGDGAGKGRDTAGVTATGIDDGLIGEDAVVGAIVDATEEQIRADDRRGEAGTVEEDATELMGGTIRDDADRAAADVRGGPEGVDGVEPREGLRGRDRRDGRGRLRRQRGDWGGRVAGDQAVGGVPGDEIRIARELTIGGAHDDRREDAVKQGGGDALAEDLAAAIDDEAGALGRDG